MVLGFLDFSQIEITYLWNLSVIFCFLEVWISSFLKGNVNLCRLSITVVRYQVYNKMTERAIVTFCGLLCCSEIDKKLIYWELIMTMEHMRGRLIKITLTFFSQLELQLESHWPIRMLEFFDTLFISLPKLFSIIKTPMNRITHIEAFCSKVLINCFQSFYGL